MCLVGLYDDRKGMSPGMKFFWQFFVAGLTVLFQVQFEAGYVEQLGLRYVPEIFSVLWIVNNLRIEGVALPKIERIRRLYVIVPVKQ